MTPLHLDRICAAYGATTVLRDITLEIAGGEFIAVLGPSGCGKTTLLKIIAGLMQPTSGDLRFGDQSVLKLPAERREAAMVFQKPLLFPYLNVAQNIAFGLKMKGVAAEELNRRVAEAVNQMQLTAYEQRMPKELSGGQEQRAALARALVTRPRVLLLDEPFSALDENLRREMRLLIRELQRQMKMTTVFVTHDQTEAALMADRIALLLDGRIEQFAAPREFYTAPTTAGAAAFFGWKLVAGEMVNDGTKRVFKSSLGNFRLNETHAQPRVAAIRPEALKLSRVGSFEPRDSVIRGEIESVIDLGIAARYTVRLKAGESIEIEQALPSGEGRFQQGDQVTLEIPEAAIKFFDHF